MRTLSKLALGSPAALGVAALVLASATPVEAQSRRHDRDRDRNDAAEDALVGAAVGALAGALLGNGDSRYIAGGALAGAAIGAGSNDDRGDCGYHRGGRCYRNQGHWEREHGIDSRDRDWRRERRDDRNRDYRYDRRW